MPYRKTAKYTKEQTQMITSWVFETLEENKEDALTISEICTKNMQLNGMTSQKIARVLSELAQYNLIHKKKGKNGLMTYQFNDGSSDNYETVD